MSKLVINPGDGDPSGTEPVFIATPIDNVVVQQPGGEAVQQPAAASGHSGVSGVEWQPGVVERRTVYVKLIFVGAFAIACLGLLLYFLCRSPPLDDRSVVISILCAGFGVFYVLFLLLVRRLSS
jgi:hypothetical protein